MKRETKHLFGGYLIAILLLLFNYSFLRGTLDTWTFWQWIIVSIVNITTFICFIFIYII